MNAVGSNHYNFAVYSFYNILSAPAILPGLAVIAFPSGNLLRGSGIDISSFFLAITVCLIRIKFLKATIEGFPDEPIHPLSLPG